MKQYNEDVKSDLLKSIRDLQTLKDHYDLPIELVIHFEKTINDISFIIPYLT